MNIRHALHPAFQKSPLVNAAVMARGRIFMAAQQSRLASAACTDSIAVDSAG
jgi:hypothetical protein